MSTACLSSLLPSTRKSSSKLCYLIWAFCAMYAVSRDFVGRLCKHNVTRSTHVYLLKHQSHTEAVKEMRHRLTAQHTQWERTCGITFKCNQSSANQTIKWKGRVYFSWMCHIWKDTNESLFKGKIKPWPAFKAGEQKQVTNQTAADLKGMLRKCNDYDIRMKIVTLFTLTWEKNAKCSPSHCWEVV